MALSNDENFKVWVDLPCVGIPEILVIFDEIFISSSQKPHGLSDVTPMILFPSPKAGHVAFELGVLSLLQCSWFQVVLKYEIKCLTILMMMMILKSLLHL